MKKNMAIALLLLIPAFVFFYKYLNAEFSYNWTNDRVTNYSFHYESSGKSYGSTIGSIYSIIENQEIQAELSGVLSIVKVKEKGGVSLLKFTIEKEFYLYQYIKDKTVKSIPYMDLVFYVDWREKSGFEDIYLPRDLLKEHEHLIKDILSLLQLKLPNESSLNWVSKHDSIASKELVGYQYSPSILTMLKGGYLNKEYIHDVEGDINSGEFVFKVDDDKLISNVSGIKRETFSIGSNVVAENQKKLELHFESFSENRYIKDVVRIEKDRNFKVRNLNGKHIKERLGKLSDMEIISGRSFEKIIKPLLMLNSLAIKDQANLFQSLSSYMRVYPNSVSLVAALLKDFNKSDYQFDIISTALGGVGTPEVQAIMREYIGESKGAEKSQVMLNLAFVNAPTAKTEELYWDIYGSTDNFSEKKKSLYAIGIMTSKMDVDSSRYKESVDSLSTLFSNASSNSEKKMIIKAMANSRSQDFYDEMESVITEDKGLKLVALSSLKDIKTEDSKNLLLEYSESDNQEEKYVAVNSLSNYMLDEDILSVYENILESESNRKITAQILRNLDVPKKTNASIQLARNYLNICPTGDLCKLAKRALD